MAGIHDLPGDLPIGTHFPGAAAATAIEVALFRAPFAARITAVELIVSATVTGQATNFFTLNVRNRKTGVATTVPGTLAFSTGAVVATASTPLVIPLSATAADLLLAVGDVVTAEKAVTGTGLLLPPGLLVVHMVGA
jgi:hypothetical protein